MKQHHTSSEAVSSSSTISSSTVPSSSEQSQPPIATPSPSPSMGDDPSLAASRDGHGQESVTVDRRTDFSAVCKWTVHNFPKIKARALWSKYFEVGGFDCRLLIYPKGDSQALPGYISVYLQIMDPRGSSSSKWDCFASYRLAIVNHADDSKSIHRDSWHRFSSKKKSHGWCDFTPSTTLFDSKSGYLFNNDSVLITADILILNESVNFTRDNNELQSASSMASMVVAGPVSDVLSGKFTWKVHNFSLFKEMIKTQKIMSPVFPAGECNLRISVYQSSVNGVEYLSMCLESKDTEKAVVSDRSCWCLFRMSVLNQKPGLNHMHRDSYGRFAADNKSGDNTSLGWNDYMKMSDFIGSDSGFLVDDTAVFSTSFHVIKEFSSFSKNGGLIGVRGGSGGTRKSDGHLGKFTWRIENFTRLKDLLKKRKITGLCIKSRRFQIGNRDCRLIVYPRGQSQPPCHLSVFLEVTDSRNTSSDWSCFVSHRLSVVNQRMEDKSVTKESQNRYSKAAKDWGWREFVTLTSLFDQDSGFLVQDTVVFSAEVLILKETSTMLDLTDQDSESSNSGSQIDKIGKRSSFTWRVENFMSFKEIMETRKIFSKFFQAGGCELRIGVYESFDTICIYLESDQSVGVILIKIFGSDTGWLWYRICWRQMQDFLYVTQLFLFVKSWIAVRGSNFQT
ncbi:MATH domain and coiled-coil domain-containing protein [Vitis vinifera]|uniref:MATH domain and coiled-coil domain-containing protein n=1 Tax=Vitis vinifera TaxID=29760 RepID=A0A438FZ63_VITVI|nr:MATH domain and coiled-coil domain-containing protein [Vitis vinifera]